MTLFQMAAAIAACDAAMILEGVDEATRKRVLDRFGKSMAAAAMAPRLGERSPSPEVRHAG